MNNEKQIKTQLEDFLNDICEGYIFMSIGLYKQCSYIHIVIYPDEDVLDDGSIDLYIYNNLEARYNFNGCNFNVNRYEDFNELITILNNNMDKIKDIVKPLLE